jgi:genome maintenance exonuclease 1
MPLISKFPYAEMKRETTTEGRKYVTPDGEKLPSVTTILDATKPIEAKKALIEWRRKVGEAKAKEITAEAAGRGTRMHKWLENYVLNGETGDPGGHPASKQSHMMAHTVIQNGLSNCDEFWGTEVALHYPKIYAGTTDLVGIHAGDEAIMDHKQTNRPKKREWIEDYFLQLTAYANAHNEVYGTKIRKGVIFMCSANNEYQEFIVEGNEFDEWSDRWWKRVYQYYENYA